MSGGGSDKSRAGFTARVLMLTEMDGMDEAGGGSREADKITQMEARTLAYGERKCIYGECTVSVEKGRTWREYKAGTESKLILHCPHCKGWVYPERESLVGWESGQSDLEASKLASYFCPGCGEAWSEEDRFAANRDAKLVHRGQDIDESGNVVGDIPQTDTLGFRWTAVNNMFTSASYVGRQEWKASRATDEVNAEKELRQFFWALPHVPSLSESTPLEHHQLVTRMLKGHRQGIVPAWAKYLTLGCDLGKFVCHWTLIAWGDHATGHIVDYDRLDVATDSFGEEVALKKALQELRDQVADGWFKMDGTPMIPDRVWIDAGWHGEVVYGFVRESGQRFLPILGRSAKKKNWRMGGQEKIGDPSFVGEEYTVNPVINEMCFRGMLNADHWKGWLHKRLACPLETKDAGGVTMETHGRMTLFEDDPRKHTSFCKHLTAEVETESFEPGKGTVKLWTPIRDANHWLDATYIACVAAHHCGVRLLQDEVPTPEKRKVVVNAGTNRPDGRSWISN
jgi:phage terminase large subunit GpA-like protein